jgi:GNAT superfamily N-acetyltransferase
MEVADLREDEKQTFFCCLSDWSEDLKDSGKHRENWYNKMVAKGLRVKIAHDDTGVAGGMIQYLPIEHSTVEGRDLYFIFCIWVHGRKQGRGNHQKRGMGKALLKAAEEDAKALGAKGMVAWGVSIPAFMRASWFKKQGYTKVDKEGIMILMWKPFSEGAAPPRFMRQKKIPQPVPGVVSVVSFLNEWCTAYDAVHERAKRACAQFGDKVVFREYDVSDRHVFQEWGQSGSLFIDGREVRTGPPPSYDKIFRLIQKRVKKL